MEIIPIIAIYGASLSTIAIVWKILTYLKDNKPKIRVSANYGFYGFADGKTSGDHVIFKAINLGKKSVFLSSAGIELDNGGNMHLIHSFFPKKLVPGDSHMILEPLKRIKDGLIKAKGNLKNIWFKDRTGKKYIGSLKNIQKLFF